MLEVINDLTFKLEDEIDHLRVRETPIKITKKPINVFIIKNEHVAKHYSYKIKIQIFLYALVTKYDHIKNDY